MSDDKPVGNTAMNALASFKSAPVFNEKTLPEKSRTEHRTEAGVWAVIRVLNGKVRLRIFDPASGSILDPDNPGFVLPDQPHMVEPIGSIQMQVEFYRQNPRS